MAMLFQSMFNEFPTSDEIRGRRNTISFHLDVNLLSLEDKCGITSGMEEKESETPLNDSSLNFFITLITSHL